MITQYMNIARVVKPHGMKGEVVVAALRGLPVLLKPGMEVALTPPALDRDRFVRVEELVIEEQKDTARVRFEGMSTLSDAENLSGLTVLAKKADLDLDTFDVAYEALMGREVVDDEHGLLGTIDEVLSGPANDVWVVNGEFGELLLPVIEHVVPEIPETGPIKVVLLEGIIE